MSSAAGEIWLEAQGLTRHFGPVRAVEDLSFQVRRGEIVGLLGPNGAGKTTVMRMLVGYLTPTRGTVRLAAGDILRDGPRLKQHLGYLPENVALYGEMTVREYLELAGRLRGLRRADRAAALQRMGETLGLAPMWGRPTSQLSRGYRQRVGLAQSLLSDPELLILDEPGTGLDPNQIAELRRWIRAWRERKAILLSTHVLSEAMMLCDRVLILSRGRLVAESAPQTLAADTGGPVATEISVRGSSGCPLDGFVAAPGLRASRAEERDGLVTWRIAGQLDRAGRLALTRHLGAESWEVLEWTSGVGALEAAFRRLTLEEGLQRETLG